MKPIKYNGETIHIADLWEETYQIVCCPICRKRNFVYIGNDDIDAIRCWSCNKVFASTECIDVLKDNIKYSGNINIEDGEEHIGD